MSAATNDERHEAMTRRVVIAVVVSIALVALVALGRRHNPTNRATTNPAPTSARPRPSQASAMTVPAHGSPTTVNAPPTTISTALADTDRLEREQPLVHALPHSSTHYRIDYRVGQDDHLLLTVTLLAVLNHDYQLATYRAQLGQYKAEALDYLRAQGQDPAAYAITYEPAEAAGL